MNSSCAISGPRSQPITASVCETGTAEELAKGYVRRHRKTSICSDAENYYYVVVKDHKQRLNAVSAQDYVKTLGFKDLAVFPTRESQAQLYWDWVWERIFDDTEFPRPQSSTQTRSLYNGTRSVSEVGEEKDAGHTSVGMTNTSFTDTKLTECETLETQHAQRDPTGENANQGSGE